MINHLARSYRSYIGRFWESEGKVVEDKDKQTTKRYETVLQVQSRLEIIVVCNPEIRVSCEVIGSDEEPEIYADTGRPMTREVQDYKYRDLAGCVVQKKNRRTGSTIGVYHAEQAGIDSDEANPWATVCETHNQFVTHPSLKLAMDHSAVPDEWCSECKPKQR